VVQGTFSAASRELLPFQDSQRLGCEMTSGCMRRATRVCQGGIVSAHAVQGKQGQQSAVYQSNVYAVGVTLAKVIISMPDRRECASGPVDDVAASLHCRNGMSYDLNDMMDSQPLRDNSMNSRDDVFVENEWFAHAIDLDRPRRDSALASPRRSR
jgi:hypothetical protein